MQMGHRLLPLAEHPFVAIWRIANCLWLASVGNEYEQSGSAGRSSHGRTRHTLAVRFDTAECLLEIALLIWIGGAATRPRVTATAPNPMAFHVKQIERS